MPDTIGPNELKFLRDFNSFVKDLKGDPKQYIKDNLDTNKDGFISQEDNMELIRTLGRGSLANKGLSKEELAELRKVQELLLKSAEELKKPPAVVADEKLRTKLNNPYRLSNAQENNFWKNERLKFKGQTLNLNSNNALKLVQEALKGNENADIKERAKVITKGLWENYDSLNNKVFRMEEILGVMLYADETFKGNEEQKKEFKSEFFKEMAKYIKENFGKDSQFIFDSLLALYQSTDWSGSDNDALEAFVKELTEGIASTEGFSTEKITNVGENNGIVAGNYNGKDDGNPYGSLALIMYKDADGTLKFKWLEYDTASQLNKVSYTFDNTKPSSTTPGAGAGAGAKPGVPVNISPEQKQRLKNTLDSIRTKIDNALDIESDATIPIADFDTMEGMQKSLSLARANIDILLANLQSGKKVDSNTLGILENLIKQLESSIEQGKENEKVKGLGNLLKTLKDSYKQIKEQNKLPAQTYINPIMGPKIQLFLGDMFAIMRDIMSPFSSKPESEIDEISRPLWNAMKEYEQLILDGLSNPANIDIAKIKTGAQNLIEAGADEEKTRKLIVVINDLEKTFSKR